MCGAAQGSLVTYDGELFRAIATRGLSEAYATLLREPRPTPPESAPQRLLRGENLVHIPDIRAEEGLMHPGLVSRATPHKVDRFILACNF